jgi:hypothetical protein
MRLKSKNAESLVMAHVEVGQPSKREIRDDSPKNDGRRPLRVGAEIVSPS